jgi:hypothetical protein
MMGNGNAGSQIHLGVLRFFASRLAPTVSIVGEKILLPTTSLEQL